LKSRIWLLDGLRSLSVVVMIIYHFLYDLEVFYHYEVGLFEGVWPVIRVTFAGLFIFLAGYSSTLSRRVFRQGIFLWVMALGITGAMLWYLPSQRIYFGVLHLLGSGYLLSGALFLKLSSKINLVMGIVVLFLQKVVDSSAIVALADRRRCVSFGDGRLFSADSLAGAFFVWSHCRANEGACYFCNPRE